MLSKNAAEIAPPEPNRLNDPKHWRDRAEEARAKGELMGDPEARSVMERVSEGGERLVQRAENLKPN